MNSKLQEVKVEARVKGIEIRNAAEIENSCDRLHCWLQILDTLSQPTDVGLEFANGGGKWNVHGIDLSMTEQRIWKWFLVLPFLISLCQTLFWDGVFSLDPRMKKTNREPRVGVSPQSTHNPFTKYNFMLSTMETGGNCFLPQHNLMVADKYRRRIKLNCWLEVQHKRVKGGGGNGRELQTV